MISGFSDSRVLVIGDVMLDKYLHGETNRISPEAPVPVVKVYDEGNRAGGAANVALNISALGAKSTIIGLVGQDQKAETLVQLLEPHGIDCRFQAVEGLPTITKLRVLSRHQQLIRLDYEESFYNIDLKEINDIAHEKVNSSDVIILSDYSKGVLREPQNFIAAAREQGISILVDPKGTDFTRYRGSTLLTPNMAEFEAVVGRCHDEASLIEKGWSLLEELGLQALLITRSEKGMTLLERGKSPLTLPAQAKDVYDVTGAGDTVIAVLGAAIASGYNIAQATHFANVAAGLVVTKLGTAVVTQDELSRALQRSNQPIKTGIIKKSEELQQILTSVKASGEKIVMTNGCFDILHPGHVSYLENAKALGDRLIVAVNTDSSVSRLKGSSRPINQLEDRMRVLDGLASVDWVIPFENDTPAQLISYLMPDVLVKGGDYQVHQVAGAEEVMAAGGEVKILNFEDGCSTSSIIEKIKEFV